MLDYLKQNGIEFELNSDEKEPDGIILSTDATILKENSTSTKIGLKCCERLMSELGGSIQTYT